MALYFYGASGHAKVCIEIAESMGLEIGGCIDIDPTKSQLLDYKVTTAIPENTQHIFIAIGHNQIRKKLSLELSTYHFPALIHIQAHISTRAQINEGTAVMAGATINSDVRIGKHCIINTNASIDHDCVIEDYVHISPNAALAGNVTVGEGTHIGIGACIIQNISIGKNCVIGAGSVVIRDVPDGCTVVGNPGKIIKQ